MCLFTFLGLVLVPQENAIVELPAVVGHCSPPSQTLPPNLQGDSLMGGGMPASV
uniref:Uncharacterized protein n=1 Tax=Anguilla anguilla TaxID=7936 RepID=A0A0E9PUU2_ANGAN